MSYCKPRTTYIIFPHYQKMALRFTVFANSTCLKLIVLLLFCKHVSKQLRNYRPLKIYIHFRNWLTTKSLLTVTGFSLLFNFQKQKKSVCVTIEAYERNLANADENRKGRKYINFHIFNCFFCFFKKISISF